MDRAGRRLKLDFATNVTTAACRPALRWRRWDDCGSRDHNQPPRSLRYSSDPNVRSFSSPSAAVATSIGDS